MQRSEEMNVGDGEIISLGGHDVDEEAEEVSNQHGVGENNLEVDSTKGDAEDDAPPVPNVFVAEIAAAAAEEQQQHDMPPELLGKIVASRGATPSTTIKRTMNTKLVVNDPNTTDEGGDGTGSRGGQEGRATGEVAEPGLSASDLTCQAQGDSMIKPKVQNEKEAVLQEDLLISQQQQSREGTQVPGAYAICTSTGIAATSSGASTSGDAISVGVPVDEAPPPPHRAQQEGAEITRPASANVPSTLTIATESESSSQEPALATAFKVEEGQVEEEIRDRILREAVQANIVKQEDDAGATAGSSTKRWKAIAAILVLLVVIVVLVPAATGRFNSPSRGESRGFKSKADDEEDFQSINPTISTPGMSTIEYIRERGFVLCGASETIPGFSLRNPDTGVVEGFNIDHVSLLGKTHCCCLVL